MAVSERTQQNSPDERKHDTHRQHIEPQCNVHVTRSWSWFRVESSRVRGQVEAITVLQCRRSRPSRWLGLTARHQGSDRTSKIDASPGIATHHDGFECKTSSRPQQRGKTLRSSGLRAQISAPVQILRSQWATILPPEPEIPAFCRFGPAAVPGRVSNVLPKVA